MSDENGMQQLTTDVALIKQEMHHLRETVKTIQSLFRWGLMVILAAVLTAVMNQVMGGDFSK